MSLIADMLRGERRTFNNPQSTLADAGQWLIEWAGGGPTAAGVSMNESKALTLSTFWKGVNLISGAVSRLPCVTYARVNGQDRKRADDHPAYYALRWEPNGLMSAPVFWALMTAQRIVRGNAYASIMADRDGIQLVPITGTVTPRMRGDQIVYDQHTDQGTVTTHDASMVLHFRGPGDHLEGWSCIRYARESLGASAAVNAYGARFFANNARASTVLEHPGRMDAERAKQTLVAFEKAHSGANIHKTALLMEGIKAHTVSLSNEDAQFLETRKFDVREVANWLNLQPHKLGDDTRTAFASLEQENQSFLDETLDPLLVGFEAECRRKLLTEDEKRRDSHYMEFMREAIKRANLADQGNFYNLGIQGGWLMRDEIRRKLNMEPLPGGVGSKPMRPQNMAVEGEDQPADATPEPAQPPADEPQPDDQPARALIDETVRRCVRRVWGQAERAAKTRDRLLSFVTDKLVDDGLLAVGIREEIAIALRAIGLADPGVGVLMAVIRNCLFSVNGNIDQIKTIGETAERQACEATWAAIQEATHARAN